MTATNANLLTEKERYLEALARAIPAGASDAIDPIAARVFMARGERKKVLRLRVVRLVAAYDPEFAAWLGAVPIDHIERKDGSLLYEDGAAPEAVPGYTKAADGSFALAITPDECDHRELVPCHLGCVRWWCHKQPPRLAINPGVCLRCQKRLDPLPSP